MAIVGEIFKNVIKLNRRLSITRKSMLEMQEKTLKKLLRKAAFTEIGIYYNFEEILRSPNPIETFQQTVPFFDYNKIYDAWWYKIVEEGKRDVTWPGKIKNFALSSGTTGSTSKKIPISKDMLLSMRKASFRQMCTMRDFDLPIDFYEKEMLMLGGSTHLERYEHGSMGDLSGILAGNLPVWMNKFYKPGSKISKVGDWNEKLDIITREAHKWDIGIIAGVPAWIQMLFERIIAHYKVKTIHDIWPNFKIYVHGGVAFKPYEEHFKSLLGKELIFLETYLASEGFIAFERLNGIGAMNLVMRNGIFYEFIPFNNENFSVEGELLPDARAIGLSAIKENIEYAIVISTNAGSWRYLIGDTIKFTDISKQELIITGRIKQFLSLCGEHLSVGNMNDAISILNKEFDLKINEFSVLGSRFENHFAHTWWIGSDGSADQDMVKKRLDEILCSLNDDYKTERTAALKEIFVNILPNELFYDWMGSQNKLGGSHKFPRVLNAKQAESWKNFLDAQNAVAQ
jgi:hypothetical protein